MRYGLLICLTWLLVPCGCSKESPVGEIGDVGFSLIDDFRVDSVVPSTFVPGTVVTVTVSCQYRYAGYGHIRLSAHGGGSKIGDLLVPAEGPLGDHGWGTEIVPGRMQIPIAIRMTSTLSRPALSIYVTCDSLLVDGAMVFWEMPEAQSVWRVDVPPDGAFVSNSSYQYVVIPSAGTDPVTTAEAQAAFTEAIDIDGPR